jgi:predicted transcriptional regulator
MPKPLSQLTRREREIVNVIFALSNSATVESIRARLEAPPSDSSVRVMLSRLERKGVVKRSADGLRHVYSVTTSPTRAKKTVLRDYLQTFFGGSHRLMMMSLLRDGAWSDEDLEALRREIDRVRRERKK